MTQMTDAAVVRVFEGDRPARVMIATVVEEGRMGDFDAWAAALAAQETNLLWDLVLVDGTDSPSPWYIRWLTTWSKGHPLGRQHRIRLLRVGWTQGEAFRDDEIKARCARSLLWGKFEKWSSYDLLLSLEVDVLIAPTTLQRLYRAGSDWATATAGRPLACGLLARRLVERVPLRLTSEPEEAQYLSDCAKAGVIPSLVQVGAAA